MTLTRAGPPSDVVGETALGWLRLPDAARIAAETASWQAQEWETARRTVQVHGVAPPLYQRLQGNSALAAVAPPLQAYLAEQHRLTGMRAMAMMAELVAVLRAAGALGIEVMPLKGAALLFGFYDDPALRPMSDPDLLVRPDSEARLAEMLPNWDMLRVTVTLPCDIAASTWLALAGTRPTAPASIPTIRTGWSCTRASGSNASASVTR